MFGDELVLGPDVVIEADSGERFVLGVGSLVAWGRRLAIPKESSDDDKVLLWIECFVLSNEPDVIRNGCAVCKQFNFLLYRLRNTDSKFTHFLKTTTGKRPPVIWDLRKS